MKHSDYLPKRGDNRDTQEITEIAFRNAIGTFNPNPNPKSLNDEREPATFPSGRSPQAKHPAVPKSGICFLHTKPDI